MNFGSLFSNSQGKILVEKTWEGGKNRGEVVIKGSELKSETFKTEYKDKLNQKLKRISEEMARGME